MRLRLFDDALGDAAALGVFSCSTGARYETDVQTWVREHAVAWLHDAKRARFQRRHLAIAEYPDGEIVAVVAWKDIDLLSDDGIWCEALAVAVEHQRRRIGLAVFDLAQAVWRADADRTGDAVAGVVHRDNRRCQRLLGAHGWKYVGTWDDDHDVWAGLL